MILVTGATGNVGGELVRMLADAGQRVRALVRAGGRRALPQGMEAAAGDLNDPPSLHPALDGADGVFLLPGYADMPGVLAEARRAGARRVVQLSGMSAGSGDMSNAITAYMAESERAARECGLAWTILRPAAFMSNIFRWLPQLRAGDVVRAPSGRWMSQGCCPPWRKSPAGRRAPSPSGQLLTPARSGEYRSGRGPCPVRK